MQLKLTIDYHIPSQNVLYHTHWRVVHNEKKRADVRLRAALLRAPEIPAATGKRRLTLTSYRKQRCRDIANLIGGAKSLVDCIAKAGLLVDDSDKWCEIIYHQETTKQSPLGHGKLATVIELEDIT